MRTWQPRRARTATAQLQVQGSSPYSSYTRNFSLPIIFCRLKAATQACNAMQAVHIRWPFWRLPTGLLQSRGVTPQTQTLLYSHARPWSGRRVHLHGYTRTDARHVMHASVCTCPLDLDRGIDGSAAGSVVGLHSTQYSQRHAHAHPSVAGALGPCQLSQMTNCAAQLRPTGLHSLASQLRPTKQRAQPTTGGEACAAHAAGSPGRPLASARTAGGTPLPKGGVVHKVKQDACARRKSQSMSPSQ